MDTSQRRQIFLRARQINNDENDSAIVEPKAVSALGTMVSRLMDLAGGLELELERRREREDRTPICRVAEEGSPFRKSLDKLARDC